MRGDVGEAAGRQAGGALEGHLHVDVQDLQCLLAADIAGIGGQEPIQPGPVAHDRLA
jgi:hypothetical protein